MTEGRIYLLIGASVASLGGFSTWLFYPQETTAKVQSIEWVYHADLRQKTLVHDSGWGAPGGSFNISCRRRYYGEEDCNFYSCNPHTDVNGRTEYDTCHNHCSVYKDWCEYDYYDWPIIKTLETMGSRHNEYWPDLQPNGPDQRLDRKEDYRVTFFGKKQWTYRARNLVEFQTFEPEAYWRIKVNHVGMVTPLQLLTPEFKN